MLDDAAEARPGQHLVYFKEAGLPVYVLNIRVLVKETRALPPVETAVLRAVRAGLSHPDEIYRFLGLSHRALLPVLAELNKKEFIHYSKAVDTEQATLKLTGPGRLAVAEACSVVPIERTVPVCWDALTRKVVPISPEQLTKARDMQDIGRFEVPGCNARELKPADLALDYFDAIVDRYKPPFAMKHELVGIKSIDRRELRYLDCLMLFYRGTANPSVVDVGFWREDGPSMPHEQAFRLFGGPDRVGARLIAESTEARPDFTAESSSDKATPVPALAQTTRPGQPAETAAGTLQSLLCHQHPGILKRALRDSKSRLMIISPWIRHQVVDRAFLIDLEEALKRGVKVHIGYGIDEGDKNTKGSTPLQSKPAITETAKRALDALAKRFKNFKFVYVGNTHRKMLVSDDEFSVITSFNWLSFRGDTKDKPRDEYGQLVRKQSYVDRHYAEGLSLIEQGYSGEIQETRA